ncbi:tyrosine-type recombinase/integrase [Paraburkholderia sp. BR10923]|uniref:tyrosine-type recombinase/integrase n=1 Tax=Paraburkholderia sp. BR10923 TaxID=3236992 RepID=UPI0034CFC753
MASKRINRKHGHLPYRMVINKNVYYFLRPLPENRHKAVPLGHVTEPGRTDEQLLEAALANYRRLVAEVTGQETLGLLIDQWLERFAPLDAPTDGSAKFEYRTVVKYRKMAKIINAEIGDLLVNKVRHADIARFIDGRYADRPWSANAYKAFLSNIFKWAVRRGMRETNPTRELEEMKEPTRTRYINDEELYWILKVAPPVVKVLVQLAAITGQRISDLLDLEWSAVSDQSIFLPEFEDVGELGDVGLMFYPSKTRKTTGRKVPVRITPQLHEVLLAAKALKTQPSDYVVRKKDGGKYTYEGARAAFKRAVMKAERAYIINCIAEQKLPKPGMFVGLHFHDLRRRALTNADLQNLDAQALGNHSSPATTRRIYNAANREGGPVKLVDPSTDPVFR